MKFLHLILRNAFRNRRRATLTVGGSTFLIFVLVFMMTALSEFQAWETQTGNYQRVVIQHSTSLANPLPIELENFLKDGKVASLAPVLQKLNWFGGYYQDKSKFFANFGGDHAVFREMWPEFALQDADYRRFTEQKNACLVGRSLMKKFDWKVGQRITLLGTIYPVNPELEIVGVYTAKDVRLEERLDFRWDYLNELTSDKKIVGTYWLKARRDEDIPALKDLIDGHTKNSSDPTETMSEKEFNAQFMAMMGNIKALVIGIGTVILVIMIAMTGNTMAMTARERVTEVAVMRTLGFPAGRILALFLAESVVVTTVSAVLAVGAALLIFNVGKGSPAPDFFPYFFVTPATVAVALSAAVVAGLASSAAPAIAAARRKIVDGLRQVN